LRERDTKRLLNGDMGYGDQLTQRIAKTAEQYQFNKEWAEQDQKFMRSVEDKHNPSAKNIHPSDQNPNNIRRETYINPKAVEQMNRILANPKKIKENIRKNASKAKFNLEEAHALGGLGIGGQPLFVTKSKAIENGDMLRRRIKGNDMNHHMAGLKIANYKKRHMSKKHKNRRATEGDEAFNSHILSNNKMSMNKKSNPAEQHSTERQGKNAGDMNFEDSGAFTRLGGRAGKHSSYYAKDVDASMPTGLEF
jgi:hypothetical protein